MFNHDVLVIGDCVKDIFILSKAKLIQERRGKNKKIKYLSFVYGEKISVDEMYHDLGGSACNAAVAISKMKFKTNMATILGDDIYSREALEELKKKKIGTRFIIKEKNKDLGLSFILLGPDRDRSILTYRVKNNFGRIRIKRLLKKSRSVYVSGLNKYSKVLEKDIIEYISKTKKPLYINPSGYQIEKELVALKRLLKIAKIVTINIEEAQKILNTKKRDIKILAKGIRKFGSKIVILTDGKKGAYCYDGERFLKSGLYPSKRLDTTGAGDSFSATFMAFYRKGYNIEDCLKFASINSANVVSVYGAQKGLLGEKEIVKRYRKNKVKVRKF